MPLSLSRWLLAINFLQYLVIVAAVFLIVFLSLPGALHWSTRSLIAWDGAIVALLVLLGSKILMAKPKQIQRFAQTNQVGRLIAILIVLTLVFSSLFAALFLMGVGENISVSEKKTALRLGLVSVVGTWFILHSTFSLRYAHQYYLLDNPQEPNRFLRGLDFPNELEPDYLDFAYMSFGIGMSTQVADIDITSREMRHLVMFHALLSFIFNTLIVALTINAISQLI
jgi:uncharacterized membrane protein